MNVYAIIVLCALVLDYSLNLVADLLNLRSLDPQAPAELRDVYEAERYRRSQEYTRATTLFGLKRATFDLALVLAFWFGGGFAWLDELTRSLGLGAIATGLVYISALLLASSLLGLPFRWYATFVVEERFGFNKTTPKTFWADLAKALGLSLVLGVPFLAMVLWFFERAGDQAWLWCWLVATAFSLVVGYVAPTWIMPIFNKFRALEAGNLREAVLAYAEKVKFSIDGLFVIDGSRRSTKANAFFTGFGRRKRVALFDTLVNAYETEEVVAIVAHEIGHYKRHHIVKALILSVVHTGVVLYLLSVMVKQPGLFEAFGVEQPSIYTGLVFFGMLYAPIELALQFVLHALSRRHELEADRYASDTTGGGESLVAALKRLSTDSLSNLTPHPFYVLLHYSHPPLIKRVQALTRTH